MRKIKIFDISLTAMAFAALIFLLPPDREASTSSLGSQDTPSASHDDAKMSHQNPSSAHVLRAT